MNPLVSIIVPVYNVEIFLKDCIDSILEQTYNNIEILAINDGSTDNSLAILEHYHSLNSNITVITQANSGLSATRNRGIEAARGKYIMFLDSDDYILPNTVFNLVKTMEEKSLDLIRFAAEPFLDSKYKGKLNDKQYDHSNNFNKEEVYSKNSFIKQSIKAYSSSACLYIIRRDILIDKNIRFKNDILHEDELFTVELFLNIKFAMYDPETYYKRRYRKNSIMTSIDDERQVKSFDSYLIVIKELYGLLEKYKKPIEKKFIKYRIRVLTTALIYKKGVDEEYKSLKLDELRLFNPLLINYYLIRYKIRGKIKNLLGKTL